MRHALTESEKARTSASKSTKTAKKVRSLVKEMYIKAAQAVAEGTPIAYCMVTSQYDEILKAMGIMPIYTENYAAVCAAKQAAEPFITKAESEGFSNVLCKYAMVGIGHDAIRSKTGRIPEDAPDGGMARPTMLLGSSASCDTRYKWYQALGRYLDVPVYCLDVIWPPSGWDPSTEQLDYCKKYQAEQLRGLVSFLEKTTGRRIDWDELAEIIEIADETNRLWWDTYLLRANSPCPMPSQDHFSCMVPAFYMIGERRALKFYEELNDELTERVNNKIGAIEQEKYRLMWGGGLPPWHTMNIFNYFESMGAVFTIETSLSYRPPEPIDPLRNAHPLERLAHRWINRLFKIHRRAAIGCGDWRVQEILDLLAEYRNVGIVMHQARSCRAASLGQLHFKNMLREHVRAPVMVIESDIVDVRDYSERQTKIQVDAFMDTVEAYVGSID
jgi:benzoyl-CoA reductase/2-hydroxyglutaryl-CoA dehydratase subunit BcrC/BadD/HgdB